MSDQSSAGISDNYDEDGLLAFAGGKVAYVTFERVGRRPEAVAGQDAPARFEVAEARREGPLLPVGPAISEGRTGWVKGCDGTVDSVPPVRCAAVGAAAMSTVMGRG